jgi:hypothetical protein
VYETEIAKFGLFSESFFVNVVLPAPEGEDNINIMPLLFKNIFKNN